MHGRSPEILHVFAQLLELAGSDSSVIIEGETGTGRVIPLNETAMAALQAHAAWYTRRFGECRPEWFVFTCGKPLPKDPTRPITSFKTAWSKVRQNGGV